ncbi:MAG: helix-turn-helix domain-containing protein, partial [Gammaproteobacteria bacterium]|nr:helix-turn-helix domain-containing protein [Gammaproteobacteria bacterium]
STSRSSTTGSGNRLGWATCHLPYSRSDTMKICSLLNPLDSTIANRPHHTQALITQIPKIAVCNRHHSVEQQLCRWLLSSIDRSPSNELTVTQELIAHMLGVRREGITEATGKLLHAGLISYRRGHITVLDRS